MTDADPQISDAIRLLSDAGYSVTKVHRPTYREQVHDFIYEVVAQSLEGSRWPSDIDAALAELKSAINSTVEANPTLVRIFDQTEPTPVA